MTKEYRYLLPLGLLFISTFLFALLCAGLLLKWNIDLKVVLAANCLFMIISLSNYFMQAKGINNPNPHVFIRSITGGMLIKMVVIMLALFIYWKASGNAFSKNAVFMSLALFFLYFVTGVYCIMLLNKNKDA